MTETTKCDGKVVLRPDEEGAFDELLLMDGKECIVHMEMMDDKNLFVGICPAGSGKRLRMNISAKGRLRVFTEEEPW